MTLSFFKSQFLVVALFFASVGFAQKAGNPVFPGWYADPEGMIFDNRYWIYPTYSAPYNKQVFMDAFSSPDMVNWTKHKSIIDTAAVKWAKIAMWAPSIIKKDNQYFLFFAANDIQNESAVGGIGIGVSDKPEGPFRDYLGKPLINRIVNGAQPIDQYVFQDVDGKYYMIYGGWRHCNIVRLSDDFKTLLPHDDGSIYKEITPTDYVEGPIMFRRNGKYYFMWSEGGWTGPDYRVAYAIGDSPFGPFNRIGLILQQNASIATGAGHHSVINIPGTDDWYIVYHRRPLGETDGNARVTCIDKMIFDENGYIQPVVMTFDGVSRRFLEGPVTAFADCNYSGDSLLLGAGKYTQANLQAMNFSATNLSALRIQKGYEVQLFDTDNFSGNSVVINASTACLDNGAFANKTRSLIVRRKGDKTLSGTYYIRNKKHGLFLGINGNSRNVNADVVLNEGSFLQKFRLQPLEDNQYNIVSENTQTVLQMDQSGVSEGAKPEQAVADQSALSQRFIFQQDANGDYQIVNYNSDMIWGVSEQNATLQISQFATDAGDDKIWELISPENTTFSSNEDCAGVIAGGAFYDECQNCVGGSTAVDPCRNPVAVLYNGCNFSSVGVGLSVGEYSENDLKKKYNDDLLISSVKLNSGYEMSLFDQDLFNGNKQLLTGNTDCLTGEQNPAETKSLIIKRSGVDNLTGTYYIKNKQSGYFLRAQLDATTDGTNIVQSSNLSRKSQQIRLQPAGNGFYNLIVEGSNKAISLAKALTTPGTVFQQWEYGYADLTGSGCRVTTLCDNSPANEGPEKLIDNSTSTKFLTGCAPSWIQFELLGKANVKAYTITSANDAPERDPLNWVLKASNDEQNWTTIDARNGIDFASRFQKQTFNFTNTDSYKFYRFEMQNNSGSNLQIAEMELWGTPEGNAGFDHQKFVLQPVEGGAYYKIFNKFSDLVMDVVAPNSGYAIRQWTDNGQQTALWELINVAPSAVKKTNKNSALKIYPNPANEFLNIDGLTADNEVFVFNTLGESVKCSKGNKLYVADLQKGFYMLRCKQGNDFYNTVFVKN